jgi:hypothetical protein
MGKNKKIIYYSVCTLFVLLLLFSNKIIASVINNNVEKSDIDIENLKKNEVYYSTDEIVIKNDLFDSFYIRGWAFCETTFDNSNKEIWVLLANDKDKYAHKVNINKRNDVFDVFKRKSGIKDANVGILNTISTVDVKNGVYKIYLYCKENAENYGLVDINQMIKKDGRGISIYNWHSTAQNGIESNKVGYAKCSIDSGFIDDNKYLQIKGWTFAEGQSTAEQTVFVRLNYENGKSVTYNTQSYYRYDVGTAFKNIIYDKSGFTAIIPKDELQDGNIQIDVLVKNGDSIYLAEKKYVYVYNDFEESFILREAKERETVNKEINIDLNNIKEDSNIKYYVDSCTLGEFLSIKGWAYISDKNASNTSVYLAITKPDGSTRVFSTAKVSRSDVAKHFNNELYYESGFKSVIPQDAIVEGDNIITIITEDGEMVKASKTYTFSYTNEK